MKLDYKVLNPEQLEPYVAQLRDLEQGIHYPIDNGADSFVIDHGATYHPFFSGLGKARFALIFDETRVIGSIAGVWKEIALGAKSYTGLYAADLKIHPKYRGQNLVVRLLWRLLLRWTYTSDFQGWDCVYFAAMQGKKGCVPKSFQSKIHLGKLTKPVAKFYVYFVPPEQLMGSTTSPPAHTFERCLRLSAPQEELIHTTNGRKDFMLQSTGTPWNIVHLGAIGMDTEMFAQRLANAGEALRAENPQGLLCFAVDSRRKNLIHWLSHQGITTETRCVVGSVSFFCPSLHVAEWADISTAEI
jgi:hypothetical protein